MIKEINFGNIKIGENKPPVTIAEAAVEHLGSVKVAMRMAETAKEIGADIIKYQMHLPDEEMIPDVIKFWGGSLDEILENYNLTNDDHKLLIDYCRELGIQYLCTPFCSEAVDVLNDLGVDAFKTGSGELTNLPMMERIASTGKPVIASTGMCTIEEIEETVHCLRDKNATFMIMNCTSIYPSPYETINLNLIPVYNNKYNVLVGHSDHTPDIWTALGAVAVGAKVVEKHFTLNRALKGPDYEVSLEPVEFKMMVDAIRKIYAALGSEKQIHEDELIVRDWAHHSVVTIADISENTLLQKEMISVKRPGRGIPAKYLEDLLQYKTTRALKKDSILQWKDVTNKF
ncbi:N-acetylneuraminate synthase family protein [candidate division KSB1 bacterium]|nr:N-acetylneuraminate synthase family protein [candidate division KSB1 bacterium]